MKKLCLVLAIFVLMTQGFTALAEEAPPPHRSPRTPVNRQDLADRKPVIPPDSTVQGLAYVLDTEKIHIGDIDIRLFGIVPPQLSASYGPQARAELDKLVTGQPISCLIRDRDQAGRFLATCRTASNSDLAIELLRRGLAVTARGSLASTDLAQPYMAAEQAAETQKIGLWSGVTPAPVTAPAVASLAAPVALVATPQSQATVMPPPAPPSTALIDSKNDKALKSETKSTSDAGEAQITAPTLAASALLPPPSDESFAVPEASSNFFARYQILLTGLIMLVTALAIMVVVMHQRAQEKLDEMKAIAAALRGELTAARGVCLSRLKVVGNDADDKAMIWPRIRVTLYQAYVSRLGFLGADLARQIASIYGQASDYATYYQGDEKRVETMPKRQALQNLINHIEEVLPKLIHVEHTGRPRYAGLWRSTAQPRAAGTAPLVEKSITKAMPVATSVEGVAASEVTHPIWDTMRKFARERFAEPKAEPHAEEQDYAALIEEEMANLTFGEAEDEPESLAANITKIRPTGS